MNAKTRERSAGTTWWGRVVLLTAAWAMIASMSILAAPSADADENPSTEPLVQECFAAPAVTALTQSGVPAAAVGETITWTQEIAFEEGDIYQDVLTDPDGELFYASYIEIAQVYDTDPGSYLTLVGDPVFAIDGVPVGTFPGVSPDPTAFIMDSTVSNFGEPVWRVYFPGDTQQMLIDESGEGIFSYAVPFGGETFSLSFTTVVDDDPAVISGVVLDGASCYAQISSGPSNRNTDRGVTSISIAEPVVVVEKTSQVPGNVAAPGEVVTYDITVTNPGFDDAGIVAYSTAYSAVLVDTLPAGVVPVDDVGFPLGNGAITASGATYNAFDGTLTWDPVGDIAPEASVTVSYDALVGADVPGSAELENVVVVDMWSGAAKTGRAYDDAATDNEILTVGGANPAIDKSLTYMLNGAPVTVTDPAVVAGPLPKDYDFTQTVTVVLEPQSRHYNMSVHDVLPDGLELVSIDGGTCSVGASGPGSCATPLAQTQSPAELPSGLTPILWYIGDVITDVDPWTYTFTYTVRIKDTYAEGAAVLIDDVLTNDVGLYWNFLDRLGAGIEPSPGSLPPEWDGELADETSVRFGRPVLSITKVDSVDVEPADFASQGGPVDWRVEVTNSGSLPAVNVVIDDIASDDIDVNYIHSQNQTVLSTLTGYTIPGPIAPGATVGFTINSTIEGLETSNQVSLNTVDIPCYRDQFNPDAAADSDRPCYSDVDESSDGVPYLFPVATVDKTLVVIDPPQEQSTPFSSGYGGPIWFQIDLENDGEGTAWNINLADTAPDGFCASATHGFLTTDGTASVPGLSFSNTSFSTFNIYGVPNLAPTDLAIGGADEFRFLYAITPCGAVTDGQQRENRIDLTYEDQLGNASLDEVAYAADATEEFGVASPTLGILKSTEDTAVLLDLTDDGEYEVATWTIDVTNTSLTQWAYSVTVTDTVPGGLLTDFGDALASVPQISGPAGMVDNSTDATNLSFFFPSIPPNTTVTITVPTYQDGTVPPPNGSGEYVLVNTASVASPNALCDQNAVCTDTAEIDLTVPFEPPSFEKTVADTDEPVDASDDPDSSAAGVAGETGLVYTLTVTVPDNDPTVTPDLWVKDIVQHGIDVDETSISIACAGGGCDPAATSLGLIATYPNYDQEYAFWLGDVGVGGAVYTITYNASVLSTFNGGNALLSGATYEYIVNGDPVERAGATPLRNDAELLYNLPALIGGNGDTITSDPYAEDGDSDATTHGNFNATANDQAVYEILAPLLILDKVADRYRPDFNDPFNAPTTGSPIEFGLGFINTNTGDPFPQSTALTYSASDDQWPAGEVGDWFRYTIEVPNLGSAAAYNVIFQDDLTIDGAMVVDTSTITTTVGASSDPADPLLATAQLAAAAGTAAAGVCAYDDGGTPGILRAQILDDTIDCLHNDGLDGGESIFLTYWAQTQSADELVSFGTAGPGIPGSASPDMIRNTAVLVSYNTNAADPLAGTIVSGFDAFHEVVIFTPITEVNYFPQGGICAGLQGEDLGDGTTAYLMTVRLGSGQQIRESGDSPSYSNGTWRIRPARIQDFPADPAGIALGYDPIVTVTLAPGQELVPGSSVWTTDPTSGSNVVNTLPDPIITGDVATGLTLTWDSNDPNMVGLIPDEIDPHLSSSGYWYASNSQLYTNWLTFELATAAGENWGQSLGSARVDLFDQLGNNSRSNGNYTYDMTDPEGCGGQPGTFFFKTPDLSSGGTTNSAYRLETDDDIGIFGLNFRMYGVDRTNVWFVDTLPPAFTYAGDPTNASTFLANPTTNIPSSMFGGGGTNFVDDMQTVVYDSPSPGATTIYYGPFDLTLDEDIVDSNGGFTFYVQVPVRRTLPYDEDTSPGVYQNTAAIRIGPDIDNLAAQIYGDDGELQIPTPSGDPVVSKRLTNWEVCETTANNQCGMYGDTAQFEVEITIPKFFSGKDVVIGDSFHRLNGTGDPDWTLENLVINCYEGAVGGPACDADDDGTLDFDFSAAAALPLAPGMQLPTRPSKPTAFDDNGNDGAFGWYLGDIEQSLLATGDDRVITIAYDLATTDPVAAGFFDYNMDEANFTYLRYDDVDTGRWSHYWNTYDPALDEGINLAYSSNSSAYRQNWADSLFFNHLSSLLEQDIVYTRVGHPYVWINKSCTGLKAIEAPWLNQGTPTVHTTPPGIPNVACTLTVTNASPDFDAIDVVVNEIDNVSSDIAYAYPYSGTSTLSTDLVWEVMSVTTNGAITTSPFAGATTGDLQDFAWTVGKLEGNQTHEISFEARIDFLDTPVPNQPESNTTRWRATNYVRVENYYDDPTQYTATLDRVEPHLINRQYNRSYNVYGTRPRVSVTKFPVAALEDTNNVTGPLPANAVTVGYALQRLLLECDYSFWNSGPFPSGTASTDDVQSCFYAEGLNWYEGDAYDYQIVPDATNSWGLGFEIHAAEAMSEIRLEDSLPYGMSFVPGTAQLWNLNTGGAVAMPDPAITAGTATCNANDNHAEAGDTVLWTFAPDAADPLLAAPFSTDQTALYNTGFRGFTNQYGFQGVISFDVVTADYDTLDACYDADFGDWDWFENRTAISADNADGFGYEGDSALEDDAFLQVPYRDGITVKKLPDNALEISGTTPEFIIEIENHTNDFTFTDLTIADTLDMTSDTFNTWLDAGSCAGVDPSLCAWIEVTASPVDNFVPVFAEESFDWTSGPPSGSVDIVWSIASIPPNTTVRIHVPIDSDKDTPTGTEWLNSLVLDSPDMYIPLTEEADITFVRPSPPPPVTKTGLELATIGSRYDVTIDVVLGIGEAWLDLAAADLVPDGIDFISYSGVSCTVTAGPDLGEECISSIVTEMPPTPGPVAGTTALGWWFGDTPGDADNERTFTFTYTVEIPDEFADGTTMEEGDSMTNTVYTVSHDYDEWVAGPTTPTTNPFDVLNTLGSYGWTPEQDVLVTDIGEPELVFDYTVEILTGEDPLEPGDTLLYTITVTNVGAWPAFLAPITVSPSESVIIDNNDVDITIDDGTGPVPFPGARLIDGWTPSDPALVFFIASMGAAGAADGSDVITFTYEATVTDEYIDLGLGSIDETAAITSYQNDGTVFGEPGRAYEPPAPGVTSIPVASPFVVINKFIGDCTNESEVVTAGSSSDWCLVVENQGGNVAYQTEVNELLPLGWTYDAGTTTVTPAIAAEPVITMIGQNQLLTWDLGDLEADAQVQITFSSTVVLGAPDSVVNVSSVTTKQRVDDPAGGFMFVEPSLSAAGFRDNDTASKSLSDFHQDIAKGVGTYDPATGVVETAVYEECAQSPTYAGGCAVDFYLVVSNEGENPITDLVVTDFIPAGMTYVANSATSIPANRITEASVAAGPAGTTEVNWTISSLTAGAEIVIVIPTTVDPGQPHGTEFLNHSELYSNEISDPVENQAKATITEASAPPTITKTVGTDEGAVGDAFVFTVTVDLPGPQVQGLHDLAIVDVLPAGLTFVDTISASCVSGCDQSVTVVPSVPQANGAGGTDMAWWVGSVEPIAAAGAQIVVVYEAYGTSAVVDSGELTNSARVLASVTPELTGPPAEIPTNPGPTDPWDYVVDPVEATVEVFAPELIIDKDVSCDVDAAPGDGDDECLVVPGQLLTYTITVTNEGTWPAYEVAVTDAVPADTISSVTLDAGNPGNLVDDWTAGDPQVGWLYDGPLAVDESITFTYVAQVAADVVAGASIVNTAGVPSYFGTPGVDAGVRYPEYEGPEDSVTLEVVEPEVTIEKSTNGFDSDVSPGQPITPGETVTWIYQVTNTGTTPLINLLVNDSDVGLTVDCGDGSNFISLMIPDEDQECIATGVAEAGLYTNNSDVTAVPANEDPDNAGEYIAIPDVPNVVDEDPSNYIGVAPAVTVELATNGDDADDTIGPFIAPDGTVTWTYVVTNTGDVPLADVTVTDSEGVTIDCDEGSNSIEQMLPGDSVTCEATGTAVIGLYENIADVTGEPVWPTDPTLDCCDPADVFSWPGIPEDYSATGQEAATDDDPSHYYSHDASVVIEKSTNGADSDIAPGQPITPGDDVTWTYKVTNTSSTPLVNVLVQDSDVAITVDCGGGTNVIALMVPDEVRTCSATGIAVAGPYTNDSTASATPGAEDPDNAGEIIAIPGEEPVTDDDPSNYIGAAPAVTVELDTNGDDADDTIGPFIAPDGTVTWTYVVTNTGDVPLADVTVTDSEGVTIDCGEGTNSLELLLPGQSVTCEATGTAVIGLYENIADVTGDPVWPTTPTAGCCDPEDDQSWPTDVADFGSTGQDAAADDDPSHYYSHDASVVIEKSTNGADSDIAPGQVITPGQTVGWRYEVTNTSNTPLVNVLVEDSDPTISVNCGGDSNLISVLAPSESRNCFAVGLATAGAYTNDSTASATPGAEDPDNAGEIIAIPGEEPVTDDDPSNYIGVLPMVDVELATNGDDADATVGPFLAPGATATWTYEVTNNGDVPLADVTVTDSNPAVTPDCGTGNVIAMLLPGESVTCEATGVAEIGLYENIADVSGEPVWPTDPTLDCCDPADELSWPTDVADFGPTGQAASTDDDPSHYVSHDGEVMIEKYTNGVDADFTPGVLIPPGGDVDWTYIVVNTSNTALINLLVVDSVPGVFISCGGPTNVIPLLLPGASYLCTASGNATPGQYSASAMVRATPADDPVTSGQYIAIPGVDPVTDDDPSNHLVAVPSIDIEVDTNGDDADAPIGSFVTTGDPVTWTYEVTNTSAIPLADVTVTDSEGVTIDCGDGSNEIAILLPATSVSCTATGTAAVGLYANVGEVTGEPVWPSTGCCDPEGDGWPIEAFAYQPTGQDPVDADDPSHYFSHDASVEIEKSTNGFDSDVAPGQPITPGETVTWIYEITNPSNTGLVDVMVTDSDDAIAIDCGDGDNTIAVLAPGEVVECEATGVAALGAYTNDSDVSATPAIEDPDNAGEYLAIPGIGAVITDEDPSNYIGAAPAVSVELDTNGEDADDTIGPFVAPGGDVTWTYVVTNDGDVPLADVTVTDSEGVTIDCGDDSNVVALLLPGESVSCEATGTAVIGLYENIADVTGDPVWPTEPTPGCCDPEDSESFPTDIAAFGATGQDAAEGDDPSHYFSHDASVEIEKSTNGFDSDVAPGQPITPGETVTWVYEVTNTSNSPIVDLTIADSDSELDVICGDGDDNTIALLLAGASATCEATGVAELGAYTNLSTVTAAPGAEDPDNAGEYIAIPGEEPVTNGDLSNYIGAAPAVSVELAANGEDADDTIGPFVAPGGDVTWTYVVTNDGDVPLADVTVTDSEGVTIDCGDDSNVVALLLPGESVTCEATGTAVIGITENIADVTGDPVWPTEPTAGCCDPEDSESFPTDIAAFGATGQDAAEGDDPSHYFSHDASVEIEKSTNGFDSDVAPGQPITPGETVTWLYEVTNPSNSPIVDLTVADSDGELDVICGDGDDNTIALLLAGESVTCEATGVAELGAYTNLSTVTAAPGAEDPDNAGEFIAVPGAVDGVDTVTDDDPSNYIGAAPAVSVELDTNGDDADDTIGPFVTPGGDVTWTYEVTNDGDVPLADVTVTDSEGVTIDCGDDSNVVALLLPGESVTCEATGTAVIGLYENIADVTGDPVWPTEPTAGCCDPADAESFPTDIAAFGATGQDAAEGDDPSHYFSHDGDILIEKDTNGDDADFTPGVILDPGADITWTYVVVNTSNTPLIDIEVTDSDDSVTISCGDGANTIALLLPGESAECTAEGTAATGQYTSTATVTAVEADDPDTDGEYIAIDGVEPVTDDDPSNHAGLTPGVTIEKATNGDDADDTIGPWMKPGETVTWTYVVTNSGEVTLADVTVTDSDPAVDVDCGEASNVVAFLAPGDSHTCEASGVAELGTYENLGVATGTPVGPTSDSTELDTFAPTGQEEATDDDLSHYVAHDGDVLIQVAVNGDDANEAPGPIVVPGDDVTWTYVVTNTSDTPLVNLVVTDSQGAAVECPDGGSVIAVLLPGESATCEAVSTGEVGPYENVGSVEGTPGEPDDNNPGEYIAIPEAELATHDDPSHYFGGTTVLSIETLTNGVDADAAAEAVEILEGDPVTWTYLVTNDGDLPIIDATVVDSGKIEPDPNAAMPALDCGTGSNVIEGVLLPGDTVACSSVGVAGIGLYLNIGSVEGTVAYEDPANPGEYLVYAGQPLLQDDDPTHHTGIALILDLAVQVQVVDAPATDPDRTLTVEVFNQGSVSATDTVIDYHVPDGLVVDDPNWTENEDGTYSYVIEGPIQPGDSTMIEINVTVVEWVPVESLVRISGSSASHPETGAELALTDIDSDYDGEINDTIVDDEIHNANGDQDDSDVASLSPQRPPTRVSQTFITQESPSTGSNTTNSAASSGDVTNSDAASTSSDGDVPSTLALTGSRSIDVAILGVLLMALGAMFVLAGGVRARRKEDKDAI